MRNIFIFVAVSMCLLAILACGTTPQTQSQPQAQPQIHRLQVINETSGSTVCEIYISPSASSDWGNNLLQSNTIAPGEQYIFEVKPDTYDVEARDCDGAVLATGQGLDLASEDKSWTLNDLEPAAPLADAIYRFEIINETPHTICGIYIASSSEANWGENWLGSNKIEPGETLVLDVAAGTYDVRADDCTPEELDSKTGVLFDQDLTWHLFLEPTPTP